MSIRDRIDFAYKQIKDANDIIDSCRETCPHTVHKSGIHYMENWFCGVKAIICTECDAFIKEDDLPLPK